MGIELVKGANNVFQMYQKGKKDPFTGKKISKNTAENAFFISVFFAKKIKEKQVKIKKN